MTMLNIFTMSRLFKYRQSNIFYRYSAAEVVSRNNTLTQNKFITAISNLKNTVRTYRNSIVAYTTLIVNPDFEYKSSVVLNDGTTFIGNPYGWNSDDTLLRNSFGIKSDASNYSGSNLC